MAGQTACVPTLQLERARLATLFCPVLGGGEVVGGLNKPGGGAVAGQQMGRAIPTSLVVRE